MRIADDQWHAGQIALHQTLEELPPVRFTVANRRCDAQNDTFAIVPLPHGDQHRRVTHLPINAHLLVASVKPQIATARQQTRALLFQRDIQLRRRATDQRRGEDTFDVKIVYS